MSSSYGFVKSSSTSTLTSPTTLSSPSSTTTTTTSETTTTTNSPQSTLIFTKKPRTLRKRPNQTFHEAATLLSTAYPNLFSTKNLKKPEKFTKPVTECINDSSEPLLLFRGEYDDNDNEAFSFLLESGKSSFQTEPNKVLRENIIIINNNKPCELSTSSVANFDLESEEFDCESMLDEEIEEGIDSIMGGEGGRRVEEEEEDDVRCGGGDGGKFGLVRALRRVDDDTKWWNFFVVDMLQISPRMKNAAAAEDIFPATATTTTKKKTKKKKKKKKKAVKEVMSEGLLLKLNYDDVRKAWSDRGSPFADGSTGNDVTVRRFSSLVRRDLKSKRRKDRSISLWMEE